MKHEKPLERSDFERLESWAAASVGARTVEIARAERLSGGAVQENWRIDLIVRGGRHDGPQRWVLRTDAEASLVVSLDRTGEFGVLSTVYGAGIKVAEPIARCEDRSVIGAPFMLQGYVDGIAQARRLTRDKSLQEWGPDVAWQLGVELAKVHQIRAGHSSLTFLSRPMHSPAITEVNRLCSALDSAGEARPALEYVLNWLADNAPETDHLTLVHGDYRTGNYLIQDGELAAILDWEFAHWGDPHEDLGWLTAKCWRFGNNDLEAGGIAKLDAVMEGYRSIAGDTIDQAMLPYWQVMAAAKWATIAILQGDRYRHGGEDSLELALTGLMSSEIELEALDGIRAINAARPA